MADKWCMIRILNSDKVRDMLECWVIGLILGMVVLAVAKSAGWMR